MINSDFSRRGFLKGGLTTMAAVSVANNLAVPGVHAECISTPSESAPVTVSGRLLVLLCVRPQCSSFRFGVRQGHRLCPHLSLRSQLSIPQWSVPM